MVRMPNGVATSSTCRFPSSTTWRSVYIAGALGDQSRGRSTFTRCSISRFSPASSENVVSARPTSLPPESTTTERSTPPRGGVLSFSTRVRMTMAAELVSALGVATTVPQCPMCSGSTTVSHVWRVDAAAGVVPRVGLRRVVHAHRDHVASAREVRGDIIPLCGVPVRTSPKWRAVDPDVAVHVDAVELEPRSAWRGGQRECSAIPADARGQVADAAGAGIRFGEGAFDAPVVRQVYDAPLAIVECQRPVRPATSPRVKRQPGSSERRCRCAAAGGVSDKSTSEDGVHAIIVVTCRSVHNCARSKFDVQCLVIATERSRCALWRSG